MGRQADQGTVQAWLGRELSVFTAWIIPGSRRACSDPESGLKISDSARKVMFYEGRVSGKSAAMEGREKHAYFFEKVFEDRLQLTSEGQFVSLDSCKLSAS